MGATKYQGDVLMATEKCACGHDEFDHGDFGETHDFCTVNGCKCDGFTPKKTEEYIGRQKMITVGEARKRLFGPKFSVFLGNSAYAHILCFFIENCDVDHIVMSISEQTQIHRNTVNKVINEMRRLGLVNRTRRIGKSDLFQLCDTPIATKFKELYKLCEEENNEEMS